MNGYLVRALLALLLAAFLYLRARAENAGSHRRRSFQLAAGALVAFAGFNGVLATGAAIGPASLALAAIGVALFIGSIASLVLSFSSGEMRGQRERIAAAAREYREQRNANQKPETREPK